MDYVVMYNGGDYSLYYLSLREVTRYGRAAKHLNSNAAVALRNQQHQFQSGVGYGKRGELLDAHVIPTGAVFTDEGQGITGIDGDDAWTALAFLNSSLAQFSINQYCGQHKHCGYINLLPLPRLASRSDDDVRRRCQAIVELKRQWHRFDETCLEFGGKAPLFKAPRSTSLRQAILEASNLYQRDEATHAEMILANDQQFLDLACSGERDRRVLMAFGADRPPSHLRADLSALVGTGAFPLFAVSDLVSWSIGCIYGRWDIRFVTGDKTSPELSDPFASLPAYSPEMLRADCGPPLCDAPRGYSVRIDSDGIVPDDPDHADEITRRVREVLELIWKDRAEAVEKEACEILGVNELRDYFRKPGKGGFWDDHVARYSKSRRKAPIYWLLQSSKKNYALWLYYHRLDKDILFKARQNYVDPKIRLEQTRLDSLRSQKTALGADAKGAKKIDKEIEKQEALLGELQDFAEKLERAAKLNFGNPEKLDSEVVYDPDLNDGVVLNIAPLHELVPWKEAKNYWEELLEGKYEWSSMGKLLRKKGLVKCLKN